MNMPEARSSGMKCRTDALYSLPFDGDYRCRAEIGSLHSARLQFNWWDPFSPHPIEPEFLSDLAEGIVGVLFKKIRADLPAGPTTDAIQPVDDDFHSTPLI